MYITQAYVQTIYKRPSKSGQIHTYVRKKTVLIFKCDNCGTEFKRNKGSMDPKRLNNNVYHVCGDCNAKKFAQSKGIEARKVWDIPVSSLKTLDQL